ncbi:MAG TPA: hypothetical protein PLB00_10440 [Pseudomonadota bacterium]|nr:hypothetical protein [Pseudomonadota bacterium]
MDGGFGACALRAEFGDDRGEVARLDAGIGQRLRKLGRWIAQGVEDPAQRAAGLAALDAVLREQAECRGGGTEVDTSRARGWAGLRERIRDLDEAGAAGLRRSGQRIGDAGRLAGSESELVEHVGRAAGGIAHRDCIHARDRQHRLQRGDGVLGVQAGATERLERLRSFGCRGARGRRCRARRFAHRSELFTRRTGRLPCTSNGLLELGRRGNSGNDAGACANSSKRCRCRASCNRCLPEAQVDRVDALADLRQARRHAVLDREFQLDVLLSHGTRPRSAG